MIKYFISIAILFLAVPALAAIENDYDKDGLSDDSELIYKTDPSKPDTDGDGYNDGWEVTNGYDPANGNKTRLLSAAKRIEIDTKKQELSYYTGSVRLGTFAVSTGKRSTPTPKGEFTVGSKHPKAWSNPYGLWMPYWIGIKGQRFGIHELPIWPGGKREGSDHLGIPVSHGCIRLGIGNAKTLYEWTTIGTTVRVF